MSLIENVGVIIRKLFARFHIADGLDPYTLVVDHGIAVGITGVVYEPRFIPIDRSIDDDVIIDREEIRVVSRCCVIGVSRVCVSRS